MTLPATGAITLNNVNVELGKSGTTTIAMNNTDIRDLFGVPSGAISLSNGYNKPSRSLTYKSSGSTIQSSAGAYNAAACVLNVTTVRPQTLLIGFCISTLNRSTVWNANLTVNGAAATLIGQDVSYSGANFNIIFTLGFYRHSVGAGTHTVSLQSEAAITSRYHHSMSIWTTDRYTIFTKTGFNRSNSSALSSTITAAAGTHLVGYSCWKNPSPNATGLIHSAASKDVTSALSSATVTGTLGTASRDWSGTAGITEIFDTSIGAAVQTVANFTQSFCVCS